MYSINGAIFVRKNSMGKWFSEVGSKGNQLPLRHQRVGNAFLSVNFGEVRTSTRLGVRGLPTRKNIITFVPFVKSIMVILVIFHDFGIFSLFLIFGRFTFWGAPSRTSPLHTRQVVNYITVLRTDS